MIFMNDIDDTVSSKKPSSHRKYVCRARDSYHCTRPTCLSSSSTWQHHTASTMNEYTLYTLTYLSHSCMYRYSTLKTSTYTANCACTSHSVICFDVVSSNISSTCSRSRVVYNYICV